MSDIDAELDELESQRAQRELARDDVMRRQSRLKDDVVSLSDELHRARAELSAAADMMRRRVETSDKVGANSCSKQGWLQLNHAKEDCLAHSFLRCCCSVQHLPIHVTLQSVWCWMPALVTLSACLICMCVAATCLLCS